LESLNVKSVSDDIRMIDVSDAAKYEKIITSLMKKFSEKSAELKDESQKQALAAIVDLSRKFIQENKKTALKLQEQYNKLLNAQELLKRKDEIKNDAALKTEEKDVKTEEVDKELEKIANEAIFDGKLTADDISKEDFVKAKIEEFKTAMASDEVLAKSGSIYQLNFIMDEVKSYLKSKKEIEEKEKKLNETAKTDEEKKNNPLTAEIKKFKEEQTVTAQKIIHNAKQLKEVFGEDVAIAEEKDITEDALNRINLSYAKNFTILVDKKDVAFIDFFKAKEPEPETLVPAAPTEPAEQPAVESGVPQEKSMTYIYEKTLLSAPEQVLGQDTPQYRALMDMVGSIQREFVSKVAPATNLKLSIEGAEREISFADIFENISGLFLDKKIDVFVVQNMDVPSKIEITADKFILKLNANMVNPDGQINPIAVSEITHEFAHMYLSNVFGEKFPANIDSIAEFNVAARGAVEAQVFKIQIALLGFIYKDRIDVLRAIQEQYHEFIARGEFPERFYQHLAGDKNRAAMIFPLDGIFKMYIEGLQQGSTSGAIQPDRCVTAVNNFASVIEENTRLMVSA